MRSLLLLPCSLLLLVLCAVAVAVEPAGNGKLPVAALIGSWHPNTHPDVIVGRILRTYSLDGQGIPSQLRLASLYVDSLRKNDTSAALAAEYDFRLSKTVEDALTLGTGALAVSGVILCTEHGEYPRSPLGHFPRGTVPAANAR